MSYIGESEDRLLVLKTGFEDSQEIHTVDIAGGQGSSDLLLKRPPTKCIHQASLQDLVKDPLKSQFLLSLVYKEVKQNSGDGDGEFYEATLFLLEKLNLIQNFNNSPSNDQQKCASIVILEEIPLIKVQSNALQVHILPPNVKEQDTSVPLTLDTPCLPTPAGSADLIILRNRVIALSLMECITIYEIETTLSSSAGSKIEIISSDFIAKSFWWSQWIPEENFLAFVHCRKPKQSSIEDEGSAVSIRAKPILSVFQFRPRFPQETVLNLPLDFEAHDENEGPTRSNEVKGQVSFVSNVNVLCKDKHRDKFRILAHSTGHVSIIQIPNEQFNRKLEKDGDSDRNVLYKVNTLHHNKTLQVKTNVKVTEELTMDTTLFQNGQFVAIVAYPVFLHLLDVGVEHEPSHHLLLNWSWIPKPLDMKYLRLYAVKFTDSVQIGATKTSNTRLIFLDQNLGKTELDINSSLLIPMLLHRKPDFNFTMAIIHYLVVHLCDVNAVKKIIYEMGKSLSSPYLTEVFQEFLIANSYLVTNKNLMPNMKIFLHFLPYTSVMSKSSSISHRNGEYTVEMLNNSATVATILLSPRQRILPHSAVDTWTKLWEVSDLLIKSTRFCHRSVAQKLILSLQCYQPEALSRATTPMSPSSPMVCNSLGDIAALFGRRTSDLQLPFVEHESCTANKQEYVYSVNLRELSTHLLKERRDWPLHAQTVAGKYMNALVESARLLCHLTCLCLHLQPNRKCKGFMFIDSLTWEVRLKLFMLCEHISIALGTLACPLPQGFTPFFAYLGYSVLNYNQFLWHVRSGTFDLQIDLVKTIMADMTDSDEHNVSKKLHLISLLPKSRGTRVLNSWSHQTALCLRARQHASDLLSGVTSLSRKSIYTTQANRMKMKSGRGGKDVDMSPLDTFLLLLTAKANVADIDLGLLAEATMLSMQVKD